MPLNLSVGDGDFTPYIKYNAKAGRFYVKPEGATEDVEITNPLLAFDMAGIKTGWIYYAEGMGPEKVWDSSLTQAAPRPPGPQKWKRGFEVMVIGNGTIPGGTIPGGTIPGTNIKLGLREFSSTAGNVISAMLRMYAEYEKGLATNHGKVPIFVCNGVRPVAGMYGTNYEPKFELKGWVERSKVAAFDEHSAPSAKNGAGEQFDRPEPPPIMARPSSADMDDEIPF